MNGRLALVLVGALGLGLTGSAQAQGPTVVNSDGAVFTLESVSGGPLFATGAPQVFAAAGPNTAVQNIVESRLGLTYMKPYWPTRGLRLQVPGATDPSVLIVGGYGDVANSFGFMPRVELAYDFTQLGFASATSAELLTLTGNLERTLATAAGNADLNVAQSLTLVTVNLLELRTSFVLGDVATHPIWQECGLDEDGVTLSIGSRFNWLQQTYRASLHTGTAVATAEADQSFAGLGLTAAETWVHPLSVHWSVYHTLRGSVLVGPNNRKSVVASAGGVSNTLVENQTTLFPVGELDAGLQYVTEAGLPRADGGPTPLFILRFGLSVQWYPLAGFASAADTPSFGERGLWLVGASLVAGMQW